jgi:hypothetical protein
VLETAQPSHQKHKVFLTLATNVLGSHGVLGTWTHLGTFPEQEKRVLKTEVKWAFCLTSPTKMPKRSLDMGGIRDPGSRPL